MSYKKMYSRKGLSKRSQLLMEADAERGLEEDIANNVLRDSINYEGIEVANTHGQGEAGSNASPTPGSNTVIKRIRLTGKLDIFPDESECASLDAQSIRSDMDSFYHCAIDTQEVNLSKPGTKLQLQSFGNGPAESGKKQYLRYSDPEEADPEAGINIMANRGA